MSVYVYVYVYIPNTTARTGCDTRSIFKRSLTRLNSEFSFSETDYHAQVKEPSPPDYLPIAGGGMVGFISFQRYLLFVKCKQHCPEFELDSLCLFPTTVANTHTHTHTHTHIYIYIYGNSTDFHTKKVLIVVRKVGSRSFNFCQYILTFIDQSAHSR